VGPLLWVEKRHKNHENNRVNGTKNTISLGLYKVQTLLIFITKKWWTDGC